MKTFYLNHCNDYDHQTRQDDDADALLFLILFTTVNVKKILKKRCVGAKKRGEK